MYGRKSRFNGIAHWQSDVDAGRLAATATHSFFTAANDSSNRCNWHVWSSVSRPGYQKEQKSFKKLVEKRDKAAKAAMAAKG